jgi:magnesium chelatase family protein
LVAALRFGRIIVPAASAADARLVGGHLVRGAANLKELVAALRGEGPWSDDAPMVGEGDTSSIGPDLADVRGQAVGRRAVEVAAAGGHHLLLVGPPGSGKTMLATRLPGL